jgi:hypothetical protein
VIGAVLAFGAAMRLGWLGTPLVLDTDALRYLCLAYQEPMIKRPRPQSQVGSYGWMG